jgi:hypothetical protein
MSRVVNVVNGAACRWSAPSVSLPLIGTVRWWVSGSSLAPTEAGNSSPWWHAAAVAGSVSPGRHALG